MMSLRGAEVERGHLNNSKDLKVHDAIPAACRQTPGLQRNRPSRALNYGQPAVPSDDDARTQAAPVVSEPMSTRNANPPAGEPLPPTPAHDSHGAQAALAGRLPPDANAAQIAEVSARLWLDVEQALHPIIGLRGVAALYSRSLQIAAATVPCLKAVAPAAAPARIDPAPLRIVLAQQDARLATAASLATLQAFQGVLCSLLGVALTERLLHPVWALSPQDCPVQPAPP